MTAVCLSRRVRSCRQSLPEILEARVVPATNLWVGPASGDWSVASNWSDGVPTADDDVIIDEVGALTITVSSGARVANSLTVLGDDILQVTGGSLAISNGGSIANLNLSGGTFTATAEVTLTGTSTWSGNSTLQGVVRNAGTLSVLGDPNLGGTLKNAATILHTGQIDVVVDGRLENLHGAVHDIVGGTTGAYFDGSGGIGIFNEGTFRHSGAGTSSFGGVPFNNAPGGMVEVTAGTLSFNSGGTWEGGHFSISSGAVANFNSGTTTWMGSFTGSGAGLLQLGGGTQGASAGGQISIAAAGATINFAAGFFEFSGNATLSGTGVLKNLGGIRAAGFPNLSAVVDNSGVITNLGRIDFSGNAQINNLVSGELELAMVGGGSFGAGAAPGIFNAGTVRQTQAVTSTIGVPFHNLSTGVLEALVGVLSLNTSGNWAGGMFVTGAGGEVLLGAGTKTWTGNYAGTGAGKVRLGGGTQGASAGGAVNIGLGGATLNFPAGLFEFSGNASLGGEALLNAGDFYFAGRPNLGSTINNAGTILNVATIDFGAAGRINNLQGGVLESALAAGGSHASGSSSVPGIFNAGLFRKSGSAAISTSTVPFHQLAGGIIEVAEGEMTFASNGSWASTDFHVATGATARLAGGTKTWSGTFTGSGLGAVRLDAGALTVGAGGATLNFGDSIFTIGGSTVLSGGPIANLGTVTFAGDPNLGATLSNSGIIVNGGRIDLVANGRLHNLAGGIIEVTSTTAFSHAGSLGITNDGLIRKTGATVTAMGSGVPFANAGTVEVLAGTLNISTLAQKTGAATAGVLTGGTWVARSGATLDFPGTGIATNNATIITDGTGNIPDLAALATNAGRLEIAEGGTFSRVGALLNEGTIVVTPGSTLAVNGVFTQNLGRLELQLAGSPASGSFGRVVISGAATLGGTLSATSVGGFAPSAGDSYALITFASQTGAFDTFEGGGPSYAPLLEQVVNPTEIRVNSLIDAANLSVSNVIIPASGILGDSLTVQYTVTNLQNRPATSSDWTDGIYFSRDQFLDPSDFLFARVAHMGGLGALGTYTETIERPVPSLPEGDYYVIVTTDSRRIVPDVDRSNNQVVTTSTVELDIASLTLDTPVSGTIQEGQDIFYKLELSAGTDVFLTGDFETANAAEFFVRLNALPTRTTFDFKASSLAEMEKQIRLLDPRGGTYYVMLHGREGATPDSDFILEADSDPFVLDSIGQTFGANAGLVTIPLSGFGFEEDLAVELRPVGGGAALVPQAVHVADAGQAFATFNLSGVAVGEFDIVILQDGAERSLSGAFDVVTGEPGRLEAKLIVPASVRMTRPYTIVVEYENRGGTDIEIPLLIVKGSANNFLWAPGQSQSQQTSTLQFLGSDPDGFSNGVLRPGEKHSVILNAVTNGTSAKFTLTSVGGDSLETVDYGALKTSMGILNEPPRYAPAFDRVAAELGATYGDLIDDLARAADEARKYGQDTLTLPQIFDFLIDREVLELPGANVRGTLYVDDLVSPASWPHLFLRNITTDVVYKAETFVDGSFSFFELPAGDYTLSGDGFVSFSTPTLTVATGVPLSNLEIIGDSGEKLEGRIADPAGRPVLNALVQVIDSLGRSFLTATDALGRYSFSGLASGTATIEVNAKNFVAIDDVALTLDGEANAKDFALSAGGSITGRVLTPSGGAFGSADVIAYRIDGNVEQAITAGFDGRFTLAGLPTGIYKLVASGAGFGTGVIGEVAVTAGKSTPVSNVSLTTGGSITGTVTDAATGLPIAGAQFSHTGLAQTVAILSGPSGAFAASNLTPGSFSAVISAPGYISKIAEVELDSAENVIINAALRPLGRIDGTVQVAGAALAGVEVKLLPLGGSVEMDPIIVVSGSNGSFSFGGLPDGEYAVSLAAAGSTVSRQAFTLNASDNTHSATLNLSAAELTGTVKTSSGAPAAFQTVSLVSDGEVIETAVTNEVGRYRFLAFQAGTFDLIASGEEIGIAARLAVTVAPGQVLNSLDITSGTANLSVNVDAAADGADLEEARVVIRSKADSLDVVTFGAVTGPSGQLTFPQIVPGEYEVFVSRAGYATTSQTVIVPANGGAVNFSMNPGRTIVGTVRGPDGAPIPDAEVVIRDRATGYVFTSLTDSNGDYLRDTLPDGAFDITIAAETFQAVVVTDLATGAQPVRADANLGEAGLSLSGVVLDASGDPVVGATVMVLGPGNIPLSSDVTDATGGYELSNLAGGDARIGIAPPGFKAVITALTLPQSGAVSQNLTIGEAVATPLSANVVGSSGVAPSPSLFGLASGTPRPLIGVAFDGILNDLVNTVPPPSPIGQDSFDYRYVYPKVDPNCPEQMDAYRKALNTGRQLDLAYKGWEIEFQNLNDANTADMARLVEDAESLFRDMLNLADGLSGFKDLIQTYREKGLGLVGQFQRNLDEGDLAFESALASGKKLFSGGFNKENIGAFYTDIDDATNALKGALGAFVDVNFNHPLEDSALGGDAAKVAAYGLPFIGDLRKIVEGLQSLEARASKFAVSAQESRGLAYLESQEYYSSKLQEHQANRRALEEAIANGCGSPGPNPEDPEEQDPEDEEDVPSVGSRDPNDILGPGGFGPQNYVAADSLLNYTIRFENVPTATAAAQLVTITHQLDADVDTSTFQLGDFGFGSFVVDVPEGRDFFTERVDARDLFGVFVDVEAKIDLHTGVVSWTFSAIDPETLEFTADPVAGFLPPNITGPEGEGFVSYSIKASTGSATGTVIDAQATIVFDQNEPIDTPAIFNTIDAEAPTSNVNALPGTTAAPRVTLNLTKSDGAGSGVHSVDVYVSDNGGAFFLYADDFTGSILNFRGEDGHTYGFATVAKDNVGQTESLPLVADAFTTIDYEVLPLDKQNKVTFTDSNGDVVTVKFSGNGQGGVVLDDPDGDGKGEIDRILVNGSDAKSKLTVSVKKNKNGGDGVVTIGDVSVNGSLGAFSAKQSDLVIGGFIATGTAKSITVRDLVVSDELLGTPIVQLGGAVADKVGLAARNMGDSVEVSVPGALTLKAASIGNGEIAAGSLAKLTTTAGAMNADLAITGTAGAISVKTGADAGNWMASNFSTVKLGGAFDADVRTAGDIAGISVKNGGLTGQISAGRIGAVTISGGSFSGLIESSAADLGKKPAFKSLAITGGDFAGDARATGSIGAVSVKAAGKNGPGGNMLGATLTAAKIASITVAKDLTNSVVLAGGDLGDDLALGGTGESADSFGPGAIGKVSVGGNVSQSLLGAGFTTADSLFGNEDDAIVGGTLSSIASLVVKGNADMQSRFAAGLFKGTPKIGGVAASPESDVRFVIA